MRSVAIRLGRVVAAISTSASGAPANPAPTITAGPVLKPVLAELFPRFDTSSGFQVICGNAITLKLHLLSDGKVALAGKLTYGKSAPVAYDLPIGKLSADVEIPTGETLQCGTGASFPDRVVHMTSAAGKTSDIVIGASQIVVAKLSGLTGVPANHAVRKV